MRIRISLICLVGVLVVSCKNEETSKNVDLHFSFLESEQSGIDFINALEDDPVSERNVLSYAHYFNGAGVGLADFNNDGLVDIFLSGNEVPNRLYLNKGNLKFEDISDQANINENKIWASGVTIVDINGDGYKDIYVCQQGPYTNPDERRNLLYINKGDLSFTEQAAAYGLDDGNQSTQAVFFDYDKDGDLDCYVMNESKYVQIAHSAVFQDIKIKENLLAASGHFYRNNGKGKFEQITEEAGMLKMGFGLGVVVSDFNGDNWPDVYVANDYSVPDFMYINQKDGTFKEMIKDYTKQISFFGMGCDAADINNDGLVDISVVDMAAEDHVRSKTLMESMDVKTFWYYIDHLDYQYAYMFNSLQLNNGDGSYSNIANFANVASSDWSWANVLVDVNLDGYKDMFVSNGFRRYARDNDFMINMQKVREENGGDVPFSMRKELYEQMPQIKLPNKMYINNGKLRFEDMAELIGLNEATYSYGAAFGDLDNDGDFDLVVNNIDQKAMVWLSNASEVNNYIKVKLSYPAKPNTVYCSKVYVYAAGEKQMQEYHFVRGYESHMEEVLLFGIGKATEVDSIKILWSNDNIQLVHNVESNKLHTIQYADSGKRFNFKEYADSKGLFEEIEAADLNVNYVHQEDSYDDFQRETLLPHRQSTLGPALAEADVNNDGLTDLYLGGAKGSPGMLYLQNEVGDYTLMEEQPWIIDRGSEDVDALFIDVNKDGWKDLFVLSGGGGEFMNDTPLLKDRFYANLNGEKFAKVANAIPESEQVSSSIEAFDYDNDGDEDLFIGGGSKPGNYPANERSVFLENDNNFYKDKSAEVFGEDYDFGIVKDCHAADLNEDGLMDLIVVGEWTNIHVLINTGTSFINESAKYGVDSLFGWWYSILDIDYDGDGDMDFIIGNMSENYKHHVSDKKPLYLFYNDFDDNGLGDIVLSKSYHGELVPARGKECSTGQMPFLAEKVKSYNEFATSNIYEIYGEEKVKSSKTLLANTFKSIVLINEGGRFTTKELPLEAQLFPILDMVKVDVDQDGLEDVVMVGNVYNTEVETPRVDAGNGLIMLNKGKGVFETLTISESGFKAPGNAKQIGLINNKEGITIVVGNNHSKPQFFKLK